MKKSEIIGGVFGFLLGVVGYTGVYECGWNVVENSVANAFSGLCVIAETGIGSFVMILSIIGAMPIVLVDFFFQYAWSTALHPIVLIFVGSVFSALIYAFIGKCIGWIFTKLRRN